MDEVRVLFLQDSKERGGSGQDPGRGVWQWRAQVSQGIRNKGDGWLQETGDLECSLRLGALLWGSLPSQMGLSEKLRSPRASRLGPPHAAARAEQGAVAAAPPRRTRSRARQGAARRPGQSVGAVQLAVTCSTPRGPDHYDSRSGRSGARPGICVLSRGSGRSGGAAASKARAPVPVPELSPEGPGAPGAPARPADCPGAGLGEGAGHQRIFVLPFFPPHGLARGRFRTRGSRARWRGPGEAERGGGAGAGRPPQAGAESARRPRRVRPAEAALRAVRRVRGAPAAIQLPGLISSLGVRLGAGSQRAAAAARRSASGTELAAAGRGRSWTRAVPRPAQVSGGQWPQPGGARTGAGGGGCRGAGRGADAAARALSPGLGGTAGRPGAAGVWGCGPAPPPTGGRGEAEPEASASPAGGAAARGDPARTRGAGRQWLPAPVPPGWPGRWCVPRPRLALTPSPRAGQFRVWGRFWVPCLPRRPAPIFAPLPFPFIMRPRGKNSSIKNFTPGSPGPPSRGWGCGATRHSRRPLPHGGHSLARLLLGDWATDNPGGHRGPLPPKPGFEQRGPGGGPWCAGAGGELAPGRAPRKGPESACEGPAQSEPRCARSLRSSLLVLTSYLLAEGGLNRFRSVRFTA